jgi:hypothetical protein
VRLIGLSRRFWIENGLAVAAAALAVATLIEPDWIEDVFGVDPDASSGAVEWAVTFVAAGIVAFSGWAARTEWVRLRARARA